MCGIFALLNHSVYKNKHYLNDSFIYEEFMKGSNRGPDNNTYSNVSIQLLFGFHRLSINGLTQESNQPIRIDNVLLICNGEIYNYKELYELMNVIPQTSSDCEVIIHCYKKFGMKHTLEILDGVFSFVLLDNDPYNTQLYVARDPYGVRPLYIMESNIKNRVYGFASEMKTLIEINNKLNKMNKMNNKMNKINDIQNNQIEDREQYIIKHFPPGCYSAYILPVKVMTKWSLQIEKASFFSKGFSSVNQRFLSQIDSTPITNILQSIRNHLTNAVYKRCATTERPIACLLSGGLDSSLVTALVCSFFPDKQIETYAIGMEGSVDLQYAQEVADFLKTKHTNIVIHKDLYLGSIPEVIYAIESYDTTTVRASVGNYLVSKYISKNSDAKVIFNGDGSDELCGGYLYMNHAPNCVEFDYECRRLLDNIHKFDVLRSDKCISSHGLEPRTPFLDKTFTQFYLSISPQLRYLSGMHSTFEYFDSYKYVEKFLLRAAFDPNAYVTESFDPILPENVLWRTKEAFSDGVCSQKNDISSMLQEYMNTLHLPDDTSSYKQNKPTTKEQIYYRQIFENHYANQGHIIPSFWMPRFVDAKDPSARTLSIYGEFEKKY